MEALGLSVGLRVIGAAEAQPRTQTDGAMARAR